MPLEVPRQKVSVMANSGKVHQTRLNREVRRPATKAATGSIRLFIYEHEYTEGVHS